MKRRYRDRNRGKVYANNKAREAAKRKATCTCCARAEFEFVYEMARKLGMQVDHVVAICNQGKHCLFNLQLLTVEEHKVKTKNDIAIWLVAQ